MFKKYVEIHSVSCSIPTVKTAPACLGCMLSPFAGADAS